VAIGWPECLDSSIARFDASAANTRRYVDETGKISPGAG
jgi:hypothetical protein